MDIIEEMYKEYRPIKCLGKRYKPESTFEHCKEVRVAILKPKSGSDGLKVEVFETRLPTRCFSLKIHTKDGVFEISSGSGVDELIGQLALQFAEGMLGVNKLPPQSVSFIKEINHEQKIRGYESNKRRVR